MGSKVPADEKMTPEVRSFLDGMARDAAGLPATYALQATTITAAGLATGGGSLAANRTITVTAATSADQETGTSTSVAVVPNVQQRHPSSPKAWVTWDVSGNRQENYNVSSVTDTGTGDWTVNFTTPFAGTGYCVIGMASASTTVRLMGQHASTTPAVGSCRMRCVNDSGAAADFANFGYAMFLGDQ